MDSHFGRSEIAGHKNYGAREIYATVIAQGKRGLIQDAEQQVPQGIASLFDLVEEHEAQLERLGLMLI